METTSITYHDVQDVDNILRIARDMCDGTLEQKHAPFITNIYFAGRTLFVDMWSNGIKDSMTFCHADEDVGFFSGGYRRLLSIKSMRIFEQLMFDSDVKHTPKWIERT